MCFPPRPEFRAKPRNGHPSLRGISFWCVPGAEPSAHRAESRDGVCTLVFSSRLRSTSSLSRGLYPERSREVDIHIRLSSRLRSTSSLSRGLYPERSRGVDIHIRLSSRLRSTNSFSQGDILHFHRIHGAHHNRRSSLSRKRSIADHCIVFDGSDVFGEIE